MNPLNYIGGAHSGTPVVTYVNPDNKQLSPEDLLHHQVKELMRLRGLDDMTEDPNRNNWQFVKNNLFTTCPKMEYAKSLATQLVGNLHGYPVLITGPTGTGKEQLAKIIHGLRPPELFLTANCGGLVDTLFESILFGYKGGAFTGSTTKDRDGLFLAARNGTVFLDEIGLLPLRQQGALMTALSIPRVQSVGDTESYPFKCQVVVATNKDLPSMVRSGEFMEDLYYRCCRFVIKTTALKDRPDDARHIAKSLLMARPDIYGVDTIQDDEVVPITSGNVRAIEHWLARRALSFEGSELTDGLDI